ncbi:MAG: hypothetical protein ACRDSG_02725 [Pseudonocardiaceae bacterium]
MTSTGPIDALTNLQTIRALVVGHPTPLPGPPGSGNSTPPTPPTTPTCGPVLRHPATVTSPGDRWCWTRTIAV